MRVLINHITRMHRGRICVAGLDFATDRHVRPILQTDLLHKHLACEGGLFECGAVIDLGSVTPKPHGPHIEDVQFRWRSARRHADLPPEEFWRRMVAVAKPTLRELFGPDLRPRGKHHAGVDEGRGQCSLGCLMVQQPPRLAIEPRDGKPRIRLWLRSKHHEFDLGVTDIRLYASDHATPSEEAVRRAADKLERARYDHGEVILSVGLTRASADWFTDQIALHWLQVNNLHFADEPYWRS